MSFKLTQYQKKKKDLESHVAISEEVCLYCDKFQEKSSDISFKVRWAVGVPGKTKIRERLWRDKRKGNKWGVIDERLRGIAQ